MFFEPAGSSTQNWSAFNVERCERDGHRRSFDSDAVLSHERLQRHAVERSPVRAAVASPIHVTQQLLDGGHHRLESFRHFEHHRRHGAPSSVWCKRLDDRGSAPDSRRDHHRRAVATESCSADARGNPIAALRDGVRPALAALRRASSVVLFGEGYWERPHTGAHASIRTSRRSRWPHRDVSARRVSCSLRRVIDAGGVGCLRIRMERRRQSQARLRRGYRTILGFAWLMLEPSP